MDPGRPRSIGPFRCSSRKAAPGRAARNRGLESSPGSDGAMAAVPYPFGFPNLTRQRPERTQGWRWQRKEGRRRRGLSSSSRVFSVLLSPENPRLGRTFRHLKRMWNLILPARATARGNRWRKSSGVLRRTPRSMSASPQPYGASNVPCAATLCGNCLTQQEAWSYTKGHNPW